MEIALFCPDHERPHAVATDAALIRERLTVNQLHQAQKLVSLALVGRGRQVAADMGAASASAAPNL
jgi:hypothetical protein